MKRTWSLLGLAAVLAAGTAFTTPAQAEGWYIGANGGWNWAQGSAVDAFRAGATPAALTAFGAPNRLKFKHDDGYAVNGFVGYGWSMGLRTEFEVGYKNNDFKSINGFGGATGRTELWTGMANVLYDIPLGLTIPLRPYVGAGIGYASWDVKNAGPRSTNTIRFSNSVSNVAYQAIAGVGYDITPQFTLTAEYRYFETPFITNDKPRGITNSYKSQMALFGLRYNFGVKQQQVVEQRVAPAPAPAPAPRSYLVFFDFDRSDLTPEGANIVQTAAKNAQAGNVTRIDVTGHTDLSGSAQYNQRLSERRAQTVKAELEKNGVPAANIVTFAKGKTEPLVPTKDGVREPQNRRVEIVYH